MNPQSRLGVVAELEHAEDLRYAEKFYERFYAYGEPGYREAKRLIGEMLDECRLDQSPNAASLAIKSIAGKLDDQSVLNDILGAYRISMSR